MPYATANEHLPERTPWFAQLGFACAGLAVALATAFATSGLWQAWAVIDGARQVARDIDVAKTRAARPPKPRTRTHPVDRAAGKPAPPQSTPAAMPSPSRGELGGAPSTAAPSLDSAESASQPTAVTRAFEALAEATERAIPVGFGAVLDDVVPGDPEGVLTLGQPPPPTYPRVDCEGIFVYIVTLVEQAPRRSSASIGVGENGPARFRRPGQTVGAWTLLAISDDWSGLQPKVWLVKDGAACLAKLAGNPTRAHQTPAPPAARQAPKPASARQAPKPAAPRQAKKPAARPKARRR